MTATTASYGEGATLRSATGLALGWATANVLVLLGVVWLETESRTAGIATQGVPESIVRALAVVGGTLVGASIAARFPRNPVGWLVLGSLSLFVAGAVLQEYGQLSLLTDRAWTGGAVAAAVDQSLWLLVFGAVAWLLLVYPTGAPPAGRRWDQVRRAGLVLFPLTFLWGALVAHRDLDPPMTAFANPLALPVPTAVALPVNLALILACLGLLVASALSVVTRYRRADRLQRAQLAWMLVAATTLPATVLVCLAISLVSAPVGDRAGSYVFDVVLVAVPVAMVLAMRRYRLYAVDRFVDTALVHLALTALLAGVYAGTVVVVGALVNDGGRRAPVVVAGATLLTVAVARPLRDRLQRALGRRFHRRRHDAVRLVDDYVRRLRDEQAELSQLEPTLRQALGDPDLRLGLYVGDGYLTTSGTPLPRSAPGRCSYPVTRDGRPVAVLVHDEALAVEPLLLEEVTRAAALPLDSSRLHVELLARLEEVQASRQRIVTATYEERRRLERDLHDGTQQRLVSLALSLRLARDRVGPAAAQVLDDVAAQLTEAVREVRELARGIHPAALTDDGLAGALESLADRTPIAVHLDVPDVDVPDDLAAAAYFTACEAVTNAVKHGRASHIAIRACRDDDRFLLEVRDDGVGGAALCPGGGLQGLTDRVSALGGELQVGGGPGGGTVVRAVLPCAR